MRSKVLAIALTACLLGTWNSMAQTQFAYSQGLIVENEGRVGVFRLRTYPGNYPHYFFPSSAERPGQFRSQDGNIEIEVAPPPHSWIVRVTARDFGMFTQRFIRIGQSTMGDVLSRYGEPIQVKGSVTFEYRGLAFHSYRYTQPPAAKTPADPLYARVDAVSVFDHDYFDGLAQQGFESQPSYLGSCWQQPPKTACLSFQDGYQRLVSDEQLLGFDEAPPFMGMRVQRAVGRRADYYHLLGSDRLKTIRR